MFYPSPISLICAILLCLPLAIVFTLTTTTTPSGGAATIHSGTTTTHNIKKNNPSNPSNPISQQTFHLQNKSAFTQPEKDDTLVPRASRAAAMNSTTLRMGRRKVAFMFLTTSLLPFAPLWELFFNNTPRNIYNIYIHADPTSKYEATLTGVFANRVIPSKKTRRHSATLASAARRLLAHALLDDNRNYMFALLSPSCIPLHSFKFTYKVLVSSNKSFIEILKNEPGAIDRWAARGPDAMLPEVKFEDFRIGSQFFVLTRKHARVVVRDRRVWSKFSQPCLDVSTCYPEEHYFATLLNMVDPQGCVGATLTHVDWKGCHDGHPRTYGVSEVGKELILALRKDKPRYGDDRINGSDSSVRKRSDPFLFARKFSVDSVDALLNITNDVILND